MYLSKAIWIVLLFECLCCSLLLSWTFTVIYFLVTDICSYLFFFYHVCLAYFYVRAFVDYFRTQINWQPNIQFDHSKLRGRNSWKLRQDWKDLENEGFLFYIQRWSHIALKTCMLKLYTLIKRKRSGESHKVLGTLLKSMIPLGFLQRRA